MPKPRLAFACKPASVAGVLTPAVMVRLEAACDILDPAPMQSFEDPAARALLAKTDILVTGWGAPRITPEALAAAPNLKLVAHSAGTVKNLVDQHVFARGVVVTNAAWANALPVAEFTLAAIILANKTILGFRDAYRATHAFPSPAEVAAPALGNYRKRVGIVGATRIGRRTIELLRPFDFDAVLYHYRPCPELGVPQVSLDELVATSDIVSLHAPSLESTQGMIDARLIASMRDGATLINTARGALVDQAALTRELVSGRINAVIDVTVPEVLPPDSPLYTLPNVLLTPHIAGANGNERERLGALVADEIERFIAGTPLRHALAADTLAQQA